MAEWLRRAGHGRSADGSTVTWSVAEGRRGRRWREVVVDPAGAVRSSLLLEVDPDGRFSHLELSTAAGLLTLHPEVDGTLHGNAVTAAGIRHIRGRAWDRDRAIRLQGSTVCEAAARRPDGTTARSALVIGLDLGLAESDVPPPAADPLPWLEGGTTWPLEESN
jgi:hypothetical protein